MFQYQCIMDWVLLDTAHGPARKHACSFSMEEDGCEFSIIFSF